MCVHWMYTLIVRCGAAPITRSHPVKSARHTSAVSVPSAKRRAATLTAPRAATRDVRFTARLAHSEKALLQRAAAGRGQTLSAYVFEKARAAAIAELEAAG